MTIMKWIRLIAIVLGMLAGAGRAEAGFITYTQTAIGTGSLGGMSFNNALITITASADTNNVKVPATYFFSVSTPGATLTVAGIGSATLTGNIQAISGIAGNGNGYNFAGFGSLSSPFLPPLGGILLSTSNDSSFAAYDLRTAIGPITGAGSYNPNVAFGTTAGNFVITSAPTSATFSATFGTNAVPEPSSLALCLSAIAMGVGLTSARGRRKQAA